MVSGAVFKIVHLSLIMMIIKCQKLNGVANSIFWILSVLKCLYHFFVRHCIFFSKG